MPRLLTTLISLLLVFGFTACTGLKLASTPVLPTSSPTARPSNTLASTFQNRFGTIQLEPFQNSGLGGTFTAHDNGDGTTTLNIRLDHTADFNPWGILPLVIVKAAYLKIPGPSLPCRILRAGLKEETVETSAYAFAPGNLIVLVYEIAPDGSQQMEVCADLGPPSTEAAAQMTSTPPQDCTTPAAVTLKGTWLALTIARNNNSDIYLLDVDAALQGTGQAALKRLTTDPATDFDPTWSPDGTRIAFRSQRDGNDEIYIMNSDGTCQVNLTNDPAADWSPAWSPDGTQHRLCSLL